MVAWENKPLPSRHGRLSKTTFQRSGWNAASICKQQQNSCGSRTPHSQRKKWHEASAIMFALLQEQYWVQLDAMVTVNQKVIDTMFERMNAIIAGNGSWPDKEKLPPGGNINPGPGNDTGTIKLKKKEMPPLRKDCVPQSGRMLRARSQCQQTVHRMEVGPGKGRGDDRDRGRRLIIVI